MGTIDIAKMRAEGEAAMSPEEWETQGRHDFETALVLIGIMQPGESLDDLPDTVDY